MVLLLFVWCGLFACVVFCLVCCFVCFGLPLPLLVAFCSVFVHSQRDEKGLGNGPHQLSAAATAWPLRELINLYYMQHVLNMWNDLARAMKASDGKKIDEEWDVLLACKKEAHVYGPSLSKQDDWNARAGTVAGTAHTQEYLLLHIAMFPIGAHPLVPCLRNAHCRPIAGTDHQSGHEAVALLSYRPGTSETAVARVHARPAAFH